MMGMEAVNLMIVKVVMMRELTGRKLKLLGIAGLKL
jgi:hypothetical protein